MMVMTAKVNVKKIAIGLIAAVGVILALILMLSGNRAEPTLADAVTDNDGRVRFLTDMGWQVANSPTESGQVKIPANSSEVFDRYNKLQQSQGYDLSKYAGKMVMRYVYKVENYPGATEPVYATLLVYKNQVIGGDVTNTSATGTIQGLAFPQTAPSTAPTES